MKVLATLRPPGPAWEELDDVEVLAGPWPEALDRPRPGVEALVVMNEPVGDGVLALLPDLRLVADFSVGYDAIDVAACRARGVAVTNTPGVLDAATADLAMALLLASRRRVVAADRFVREGRWRSGWASPEIMAADVTGATLGIVGLGRIGGAVARRARGFDLRLLYHQRTPDPAAAAEYRDLDDLLRESDLVSLHVPLSAETRGLLSRRRLTLLRDGATLVNTARGAIVDERALVDELVSGRILAGLDVFWEEPGVPAALLDLPNVVLTPHVGSATAETRAAMTRIVVDNILAAERGEDLPTPV